MTVKLRTLFTLIALTVIGLSQANAQSTILQGGPTTAGHVPMYATGYSQQPIVQDSGPAAGGPPGVGLSELGITARGSGTAPYANAGTGPFGTNNCDQDAPSTNPGGYHYICLSPNAQGGGLIAYGAAGAATPEPLTFNINGSTYTVPGSGSCLGCGSMAGQNSNAVSITGGTIQASVNGALIPDQFIQSGDDGDDALAIQRAINAECALGGGPGIGGGGEIDLLARHYTIKSAIIQQCAISVIGQGWQEAPTVISQAGGSWLDIVGSGFIPWTIQTTTAKGSRFANLAVSQPGQPAPVTTGTWNPVVYPFVFNVYNIGGKVEFDNIFMDGVYDGISGFNTGRLIVSGLYGQWFNNMIFLDQVEDVSHINGIHEWTYYSADAPVIAYTQANTVGINMNRVDTPFIDGAFFYGLKAGLQLNSSSSGIPSQLQIGDIACDSTQYCMDVEANGTSGQIANMNDDGQAGTGSGVPLSGAAAIHMGTNGSGIFQIGSISAQAIDAALITDSSTNACTNIFAANVLANFQVSTQTSVSLFSAPTLCGGNQNVLNLASTPSTLLNTGIGQVSTNIAGPGIELFQSAPLQDPGFLGNANIIDPSTSDNSTFSFIAQNDTNGVNLELEGNGTVTPNKWIRVINGTLEFMDNNYSTPTFLADDAGNTTVTGHLQSFGYTRPGVAATSLITPCSGAIEGAMETFTDSNTNTWGATIAAGGSNIVLGYCDGSTWTVAGK